MKATRIMAAALIVAGGLGLHFAQAQKPAIGRTEFAHADLGDAVREVIHSRVDFASAAAFPRHSHPRCGSCLWEVAYVLEGSLEYQLDGKPPVTLKAGDSLFIPAGTIHSARNVGDGNASELATYVIEKGKPLVVTAP